MFLRAASSRCGGRNMLGLPRFIGSRAFLRVMTGVYVQIYCDLQEKTDVCRKLPRRNCDHGPRPHAFGLEPKELVDMIFTWHMDPSCTLHEEL